MQYTPTVLPLLASGAILLALGIYAWRYHEHRLARLFVMMMFLMVFWVGAVLLEALVVNPEYKLIAGNLVILPASLLAAITLGLVLEYTGLASTLIWYSYFLVGLAVITNILVWTNDYHHLWLLDAPLTVSDGPIPALVIQRGPWFNWIYAPANYVGFFVGIAVLFWALFTTKPAYRWQIFMLIVALIVPLIGNALVILKVMPYLTAILFLFSGIIIAWNMFRFQFMELTPVARDVVLENVRDIVLVLDTQNRVVDFNPAAMRRLLLADQDVIGQPVSRLFPEEADLIEIFQFTTEVDAEIMLHDEQTFFNLRISPLRGRRDLIGKVVVLHDITASKAAEKALQEDYDQLQVLRQIDMELSRRLDVDYVIDRALNAAAQLSGADSITISLADGDTLKMVGGLDADVEHIGARLPSESGIVGRVLRQQQAELVLDVKSDPDYVEYDPAMQAQMSFPLIGHQRLLGVLSLETSDPQRFTQKTFEYLGLLATRITVALDNAYAYREMAQLVEDLDAFAHTVAHDLKNPLGFVMGYANMLMEDLAAQPEETTHKYYMGQIVQGGGKMLTIINELLLLASVRRLDEISIEPLEMFSVVQEALAHLPALIEEHEAEIIIEEADTWPVAIGYAPWVEEVWTNYISNAIKYGGTPPQVTIGAVAEDDNMVRFWVRDNGPGLDDEQQSRLFNQFTRLDETRAQGHGLGLSIVQRIVEKLNGQVCVESTLEQGSTFCFLLPAADDQRPESSI